LKNNVILVAIQYRLAVFGKYQFSVLKLLSLSGFASTGKEDLPGNLGYFDQAEALKFIHRNIKFFGGDPDRITILGCSAGGKSYTMLFLDNQANCILNLLGCFRCKCNCIIHFSIYARLCPSGNCVFRIRFLCMGNKRRCY
jgi:hypothetical protein